jgi:DNA polymerase-1
MSECVLAYFPDPFAIREPVFMLLDESGIARIVSAAEVSNFPTALATHSLAVVVDELRRLGLPPPSSIIDVEEGLRLASGLPKDQGGALQWNIWRNLRKHFVEAKEGEEYEAVFRSQSPRPDAGRVTYLLHAAVDAIRRCWTECQSNLTNRGSADRFWNIEAPLIGAFAYRQFAGIATKSEEASRILSALAREKYEAYRTVADRFATNPTGLNFWNVQPFLRGTELDSLAEVEDGGQLREAFKLKAFSSEPARAFLTLVDAARDELIIQRACGDTSRIFPTFQVVGTVTSRILADDPPLQFLRRRYRGVLSPDIGRKLVYLDYSQFEPGVLAHLSQDEALLNAYNSGDLYSALSTSVFGTSANRDISKRMFLAYCYGMGADRIARFVCDSAASGEVLERHRDAVVAFFSPFAGLQEFRRRAEQELFDHGWAASLMGNRRYRTVQSQLTSSERRWCVNHPVQATASLIFKEALNALILQFGNEALLLPMHDGVLLQLVEGSQLETDTQYAVESMKAAFSKWCPSILPKVSNAPFA